MRRDLRRQEECQMTAKKKPIFLVAFIEGGNLTGIVTNSKKKLLVNILDLQPYFRDGQKMTDEEVEKAVADIEKKAGNQNRFEDKNGDADISVVNITGMIWRVGKVIW